ncbi:thymidylate synthase [Desulfovibrio sp.]|uniref:thymidylate synthase n=1 Tax=Desulfovibrio sp. TaxID=885 RepID=UPI0025BB1C48|nr:thymidylate synthase [Desulfovibrio sp.]
MIAAFEAKTANDVWLQAYKSLQNSDSLTSSRLGPTRELLHVNFSISDPRQRWTLSRFPALNPAFAIVETLWILAGDNTAALLNYWNPLLPQFSGNSECYHGAYGYRLRRQFGFDQLEQAYNALRSNPYSRQVILQIWDPRIDFPTATGEAVDADIPCNICALPKVRDGKLEWLQIMRSNDLYLGTPYNFIQFTTLQEVLSGWIGIELGAYHQISDSLHIYEKDFQVVQADKKIEPLTNTDNLALSKNAFEAQMKEIMPCVKKLSSPTLQKHEFSRMVQNINLHKSYKNLFLIVAADAARRRGWEQEMHDAIDRCSNALLCVAFSRWEKRHPLNKI